MAVGDTGASAFATKVGTAGAQGNGNHESLQDDNISGNWGMV